MPCLVSFQGFGYHYGLMDKDMQCFSFGFFCEAAFSDAVNGKLQIFHWSMTTKWNEDDNGDYSDDKDYNGDFNGQSGPQYTGLC